MKRFSLSLLAGIALAIPVALLPVSGTAAPEPPPATSASPELTAMGEAPRAAQDAHRLAELFDQDELAELAALEAENTELQEQKAGFFGPRIGTIIIIALLLVLIL